MDLTQIIETLGAIAKIFGGSGDFLDGLSFFS